MEAQQNATPTSASNVSCSPRAISSSVVQGGGTAVDLPVLLEGPGVGGEWLDCDGGEDSRAYEWILLLIDVNVYLRRQLTY